MSISLQIGKSGSYRYKALWSYSGSIISAQFTATDKPPWSSKSLDIGAIRTGSADYRRFHSCDHDKAWGRLTLGSVTTLPSASSPGGAVACGTSRISGAYEYKITLASTHPCVPGVQYPWAMLTPGDVAYCVGSRYYRGSLEFSNTETMTLQVLTHPILGVPAYFCFASFYQDANDGISNWYSCSIQWFDTAWHSYPGAPRCYCHDLGPTCLDPRNSESYGLALAYANGVMLKTTPTLKLTDPSWDGKFSLLTQNLFRSLKDVRVALTAQLVRSLPPGPSESDWGDLCQQAINGFRHVDINTCVWLKEVLELKNTLRDTYSLITGDVSPKAIARLFLSDKYGVKLTIADSVELAKAIKHAIDSADDPIPVEKSASQGSMSIPNGTRTMIYSVYANGPENGFLNAIKTGLDWDVLPTLQNLWDAVPLSFVADWFVDVEGFCSTIDTMVYEQYLDVEQVIFTYKDVYAVKLNTPFVGELYISSYHRNLRNTLHTYYPDFDRKDRWKDNIDVITALIVTAH